MSDDSDNELGIDLGAWEAPPPPAGIADAVIARMQTTHVGAPPVEPEAPRRRWWLLGGGLAAAPVLAATVAVVALRGPADGQGTVAAETARHLALGPTTAELDPGTHVMWRRAGDRVTAAQSAGSATWRVTDDDTLTIDAVLASIEASDANLRVEVAMKDETKKTIATSAITAAAVALVTVIVYDGSVRVTETSGKTTTVQPGVAYQIRATGSNVIEEEVAVGASPQRIADLERELAEKRAQIAELERKITPSAACSIDDCILTNHAAPCCERYRAEATVEKPPASDCDEVACVLNNYEGECCAKFRAPTRASTDDTPESLDRAAISRGIAAVKRSVVACGKDYTGNIKVKVSVEPSGRVASVGVEPADAAPATCIADVIRAARFDKTRNGGVFSYAFALSAQRSTASCDPAPLVDEGTEAFSAGRNALALQKFEAADACRPDVAIKKRALAAACKAKNLAKARLFWHQLPASTQQELASFCVRTGITLDQLNVAVGTLRVQSQPAAKILVDGVAVGTTPVLAEVPAGKHKVTFVVGDDKYTFSVTVKSGETSSLVKDLRSR